MVSVIIPTYNRRDYLKEAVESVLAQSGDTPEVIVVDDGSTDGTAAVLRSFGASLRHVAQPRSGVSSARNKGIRIAAGDWLAFLDSDDLWLPRKLAVQLDYIRENPSIRVCQTEETWIRNGKRINPKKFHKKPAGHCFPLLLDRCLVSPSAVMIHRDVFGEVGYFDESLPACEDYDLWLRIGCRYPIGLIEEPLIVKRGGHPDQLSATVESLDRYRIQAIVKVLRSGSLDDGQMKLAFDALGRKCRVYGQGCSKRGRLEEAQSILDLPGRLAAESGACGRNGKGVEFGHRHSSLR
jgi:glycosyltransferase involved in cell wall biosynthesis